MMFVKTDTQLEIIIPATWTNVIPATYSISCQPKRLGLCTYLTAICLVCLTSGCTYRLLSTPNAIVPHSWLAINTAICYFDICHQYVSVSQKLRSFQMATIYFIGNKL